MPKVYAAGDQVLAADINPIVAAAGSYGTDAGGDDIYAITFVPTPGSYADGDEYTFKASTANTGAATLNVNGLGAKSILRADGSALADGDIPASMPVRVKYDGTNFRIISALANMPIYKNGTFQKDAADASTTQNIAHGLGRIPRYVSIMGVSAGVANGWPGTAKTVYNGVTQSSISEYNTGVGTANTSVTFLLNTALGNGQQVGVVTFDATNIIITWTKTNSPTGIYQCVWEAEA